MLLIVVSIVVILFKRIILGKNIGVYYTPFDNITGNTSIEFHEEQNEEENEDDQGNDKDKNKGKRFQPLLNNELFNSEGSVVEIIYGVNFSALLTKWA